MTVRDYILLGMREFPVYFKSTIDRGVFLEVISYDQQRKEFKVNVYTPGGIRPNRTFVLRSEYNMYFKEIPKIIWETREL